MLKVQSDKMPKEELENLEKRLSNMCSKLGFLCTQVNGQRICTSTRYKLKPNSRGTEIFIGKIPRNIFEDELIPLFLRAGELYQFRIMLNFSLKNRGFAFATYTTIEGAERAISFFDNFEICRNARIGVFKSVDNCRLFFGNIPQNYTKRDIIRILNENLIEGVSDVIMYKDLLKPELNRGYVFVEFATHRDAAMAKKQLYPGCLVVQGQSIFVDWADPIPDVDSKVMAKVTKLFIHHLPLDLTKEELFNNIALLVDAKYIVKVHKQLNYAFVHFLSREVAEYAKEALKNLPFPDIEIEWARPRQYSKQQRLESPPTSFCLSLPPKMRRHYQQYISSFLSETSSTDSLRSSPSTSKSYNWKDLSCSLNEIAAEPSFYKSSSILKAGRPLLPRNEIISNGQNSFGKEMEAQKENLYVQPTPMTPTYDTFSRSLTSMTSQATSRTEEAPHRNPLIGLPINLIPLRKQNTPPPVVPEKFKYNDLILQNTTLQNPFYQSYLLNNNSSFGSNESRYQQQTAPSLLFSGRSTSVVPNRVMSSAYKQHFDFF